MTVRKTKKNQSGRIKKKGMMSMERLRLKNKAAVRKVTKIRLKSEKIKELTDLSAISHALSDIYTGVFFIDLEKDIFKIVKAQKEVRKLLSQEKSAKKAIYQAIQNTVDSEEKSEILEYIDLSTLSDRMQSKRYLNKEYKGKYSGWVRGSFIEVAREENGQLRQVLYTYQIIDQEKKREKEQQKMVQKALQAANAANQAKSSFLFNMSHDIRTPMNAILGYTALAQKGLTNPSFVKEYLDKIQICGQGMLSILDHILELSHIESGKVILEEEAYKVENVLEECLTMTKTEVEKRYQDITIKKHILYPYVFIDHTRLMEILLNLLSNAIKYTGEHGKIQCFLEQSPHPKEGWVYQKIVVKDNGIGMSQEFQTHIFESFSREHTSTNSGIQGTGLGMGIVKKLVDMMDGTIFVKSKLGEGSLFSVCIPCRVASYEDTQPKKGKYL